MVGGVSGLTMTALRGNKHRVACSYCGLKGDYTEPVAATYAYTNHRSRCSKWPIAATPKCEHWGHAEGEWKYSCCACSGMPGGCKHCATDWDGNLLHPDGLPDEADS